MARKNGSFLESAKYNNYTYQMYFSRLSEMAISMFKWTGLPTTVDERFLELTLFTDGVAVFFRDEILGELCLKTMLGGQLNVYNIPTQRTAYANNGYTRELDESNSVLIFNNVLHINSALPIEIYSKRLYELDRTIDVNSKAQKTPVLITCNENERLAMKNLYMKYDGNMPFIFANKRLSLEDIRVLKTDAPYNCDKLYALKTQIWNEALTCLGIPNINFLKKERLISDEVLREQGGTIASRYSRLNERQNACKRINEMFGLNIWCEYRTVFSGELDFAEGGVQS